MNETLEAVVIEVSRGNVRHDHLYLRGAFGLFPDDRFGGSNVREAGHPVTLHIGGDAIQSNIDRGTATVRKREAFRRSFPDESMQAGDLVLVERLADREFQISKASERALKYHL